VSKYDQTARETWVEIDAGRLRKNLQVLRDLSGTATLLVAKANAYGHGMEGVARIAEQSGVEYLGVANVSEAYVLRQSGIKIPILAMGYVSEREAAIAVSNGIDLFVWTDEQIQFIARAAQIAGLPARVHLKVDTGMGRLGCMPGDTVTLAAAIARHQDLDQVGLCTHFSKADIITDHDAEIQLRAFEDVVNAVTAAGLRPRIVHCANSPATLRFPEARFDMVRLGIVAYGIRPDPDISVPAGVSPVLRWHARLGTIRRMPPGTPLSYGGEYRTREHEWIGVLPLGYADGYRRVPRGVNRVIVGGEVCPVVGRVCMDQCLVRLPGHGNIRTGDLVIILGEDGGSSIDAEALGASWGTNAYDAVCGISSRVPRVFT
jgi:Alr-MurF fusion protein